MGLHDIFALLIGSLTLSTAVMVVLSRNAIYAAIYLLLTLLGVACEYVMLQAHFLAIIQVLVYAGAVVVLIVFVLMMLGFGREQLKGLHLSGPAIIMSLMLGGVLLAAGGGGLMGGKPLMAPPLTRATVVKSAVGSAAHKKRETNRSRQTASSAKKSQEFGTVEAVGRVLVTHNIVSFEVISVMLLMAIVGVIMLLREREYEAPVPEDGRGS